MGQTLIVPVIEVSGAGSTGPKTLNVSNITFNVSAASLPTSQPAMISMAGVNGGVAGNDYGSVAVGVNNVMINMQNLTVSSAGIYARTDTAGATAAIESSANVTLNGTAGNLEGIRLESPNGYSRLHLGYVTNSNRSGIAVTSTSGSGAGVRVTGGEGVTITTDADTYIDVTGGNTTTTGNAYGIHVSSTSVSAIINNAGLVQTRGYRGHAIFLEGPEAEVTNTGNITTTGEASHGIYLYQQTGTTQQAQVNNSGRIYSSGDTTDGLRVEQRGSATNTATITNSGTIISNGSFASYAIDAWQESTTANGVMTVTNQGDLTTGGIMLNYGLGAYQRLNSGTLTVTNDGTVTTTGSRSFGIYARQYVTTDGSVTATNNGSINTRQSDSHGLYASQTGGVNSTISATSTSTGEIETQGNTAHGLYVEAYGSGLAQADNAGQITTGGNQARGIYVMADHSSSVGGTVEVRNTGAIRTSGGNASGIYVNALGDDTIQVIQGTTGSIVTADGAGIQVAADAGNLEITTSGSITTGQATASTLNHGIDAGSNSGKTEVEFSNGTIKVVGTNTGGGNAIG
ncbi:beta strand repeat-containing protein, partial [Saezia sanguinis]|uniref:beta strand repeat-containing protein n=1 Tax=Saezia sanguinis TaxID=1965230 RepID=UPI0011D16708